MKVITRSYTKKVHDLAERYNARALENGWESRCDPTLSFVRSNLSELLMMWQDRAQDGLPARAAFDARSMMNVMRIMLIAERLAMNGKRRWRYRFFGTDLVRILGEWTNCTLDEVLPLEHAERWNYCYDSVVDEPAPMRIVSSYQLAKIDYLDGEGLLLPLADGEGEPNLILSATYVRPKTA